MNQPCPPRACSSCKVKTCPSAQSTDGDGASTNGANNLKDIDGTTASPSTTSPVFGEAPTGGASATTGVGTGAGGASPKKGGTLNASTSMPRFKKLEFAPGCNAKKVIGVVSGKGGVGKSLSCALLACALMRQGFSVGILDADITGPSIPRLFDINAGVEANGDLIVPATSITGIKIISSQMLVNNADAPLAWRGPMVTGAIRQFFSQTNWGQLDYLLIDMPPGTSDVLLTVLQLLPISGIVSVATPQDLVGMIVGKAINLAHDMQVSVVGLVENMSYFKCGNCQERHEIFGSSQLDALCKRYGIMAGAQLPLISQAALAADKGSIEDLNFDAQLNPIIEALIRL